MQSADGSCGVVKVSIPRTSYRGCGASLKAVAAVAAGCSEAELRLLLELAARAADQPEFVVRCSWKDLCGSTRLVKSAVYKAIEGLSRRSLIVVRKGGPTEANSFLVSVLRVASVGGGSFGEPPTLNSAGDSGSFGEPPLQAELALPQPDTNLAPGLLSIDIDRSIEVIDRMTRARASHFPAAALVEAKRWVYGYMCRFGPQPPPAAPDDLLLAQWLSLGPAAQMQGLIGDLMIERRPVQSYGWFLTVALDRLHGVTVEQQKSARAVLVVSGPCGKGKQANGPDDLAAAMKAAGEAKRFGGGGR